MKRALISVAMMAAISFGAVATELEITTENNHEREIATGEAIQDFVDSHDVSSWMFTNRLHVDLRTIPHSHPVLTLHTRNLEYLPSLYSTYLHEQIHWHLTANRDATEAAKAEIAKLLGPAKTGFPYGSDDEDATYMHVIVCYLEIDAMRKIFGDDTAAEVLAYWQKDHYTWVYEQVAAHRDALGAIIDRHGLRI
ncbi:hypothetical protein [Kordiimonas gwangyangensis]|uniref:hypothetical protein n=1 Tax=Kordiimonas gwangyangensis TaxID=288022 RepID=UPI000369DE16|nr:hypothetical protein [Kordiimonas gwangyangensis]